MHQPEILGSDKRGVNLLVSDNFFKKTKSTLKNGYSFKVTHCCLFAEHLDEFNQQHIKVTELGSGPILWIPLKIDNIPAETSSYIEITPLFSIGNFYVCGI